MALSTITMASSSSPYEEVVEATDEELPLSRVKIRNGLEDADITAHGFLDDVEKLPSEGLHDLAGILGCRHHQRGGNSAVPISPKPKTKSSKAQCYHH